MISTLAALPGEVLAVVGMLVLLALYVARTIRTGKADEATLVEIPRPFQTSTKHRRERREQGVQLDLRRFDFEDDTIVERPVQWGEYS